MVESELCVKDKCWTLKFYPIRKQSSLMGFTTAVPTKLAKTIRLIFHA